MTKRKQELGLPLSESLVDTLERNGWHRWTRGENREYDRLYPDTWDTVGLHLSYYKTGNIAAARLWGEEISNSQASRLTVGKVFIDIKKCRLIVNGGIDGWKRGLKEQLEDMTERALSGVLPTPLVNYLVGYDELEDKDLDVVKTLLAQ